MRLTAAICAALLLTGLAGAAEPCPTVGAEGVVEAGATDWLVCAVAQRYRFPVIIEAMVPEWSHVGKGQVVVRLQRSPLMDVEKGDAEADLAVAQAEAQEAQASAASSLAQRQAQVAAAQSALDAARQRLRAVEQEPLPVDEEKLSLQVRENASEQAFATVRLNLLAGLKGFGLCSDAEMESARHDVARRQAQRACLSALGAELKPDAPPPALLVARAEVRQAELELQAAGLRMQTETDRQRLLCEAARCGHLQKAQSQLDLVNRKIEALNVPAPHGGYLEYGNRWENGLWQEKLAPGDTVWYSQNVAAVVDPSQMRIRARVDERQVPRLRAGDAAQVQFAAVPGRTYAGTIAGILGSITSPGDEGNETPVQSTGERKGTVLVALADADAAVRPGMTADLTITPSGAPPPSEPAAAAPADPERDVFLYGQFGSRTNRIVCAPFPGRVSWAADPGTQVDAGDRILTLDPGLEENWRQTDESELKRLDLERQAASLSADLADVLAPLLRQAAEQKVQAAQVKLDELEARPLASEKLKAQNALQEALYQSRQADAKLDVYKRLAAGGMASAADVARYKLQAALSSARADSARAELDRTLHGASAPALAVARAELDLARADLEVATTSAREDAAVARANLTAAEAALDTYRKQAERRRQRAESADVVSPVRGVLTECSTVGEVREKGWWVASIAENSRPVVYAVLNECDLPRVSGGMPAQVEFAGLPGRTFAGHVGAIEDWPEPPWWRRQTQDQSKALTGRLFQAVIELDEEPPVYIGMSAQVRMRSAAPAAGQEDHG